MSPTLVPEKAKKLRQSRMFYFCGANLPKPTIDPHFFELFEERNAVGEEESYLGRVMRKEQSLSPPKKILAMEEEPM